MTKEAKATGQKAVVCPPIGKATGQKSVACPPIGKATGIKTWPEDDRPREKLLKKGAGALFTFTLFTIGSIII